MRNRNKLEFAHTGENNYIVKKQDGTVLLCLRAYGPNSFIVNKHLTTMMTKRVCEEDRFDRVQAGEYKSWHVSIGPHSKAIAGAIYADVFNEIAVHVERQIARMITE